MNGTIMAVNGRDREMDGQWAEIGRGADPPPIHRAASKCHYYGTVGRPSDYLAYLKPNDDGFGSIGQYLLLPHLGALKYAFSNC